MPSWRNNAATGREVVRGHRETIGERLSAIAKR